MKKLLVKLKANDVPPHILRWMGSFLLDRTQQVKIDKTVSSVGNPNGGVPQGTVSGPRHVCSLPGANMSITLSAKQGNVYTCCTS